MNSATAHRHSEFVEKRKVKNANKMKKQTPRQNSAEILEYLD